MYNLYKKYISYLTKTDIYVLMQIYYYAQVEINVRVQI